MARRGQLPSLVVLPGMDGTGELLTDFAAACDGIAAVQIVDYPRDRIETYDAVVARVRALLPSSGRYVLMGESYSGPVALRLAAERPPGLVGVILTASFLAAPWPALRLLRPLVARWSLRPDTGPITRALLFGRHGEAVWAERLRAAVSSVSPRVFQRRLLDVLDCDVRLAASRIAVPLLYLRGSEDRLIPERCADEVVAIVPSARIASVEGPHLLLQVAIAPAVDAVAHFLAGLAEN